MVFRRGGAGKKRDAIEPEIIAALRAIGCQTFQLAGTGLPDVLVRVGGSGRWVPLEIKSKGGRLTKAQGDLSWPVVRTVDEAIQAVWG